MNNSVIKTIYAGQSIVGLNFNWLGCDPLSFMLMLDLNLIIFSNKACQRKEQKLLDRMFPQTFRLNISEICITVTFAGIIFH